MPIGQGVGLDKAGVICYNGSNHKTARCAIRIGVVPTLHGYSAVVLPPYHGDWELSSPKPLAPDLLIQLRGQILSALSQFSFKMAPWTNILSVSLFWALWGGTALYLRLARYSEMGWKFVILYGWIMFLFFGDGLFSLGRFINQIPNLRRAKSIRDKAADSEWVETTDTPQRIFPLQTETEQEYIERMVDAYPELKPYYDEMLIKEPPLVFSLWPLGLLGIVRYLFIGPRIPRPHIVIELGDLQ